MLPLPRPDVMAALRNAVRETMKTHPFEIEAWTVMPDHIHCVLIIKDDYVPLRWGKIKALTTKALPEFSSRSQRNAKNSKARETHGYGKYPDDWKYITPAWLDDNFSDYKE